MKGVLTILKKELARFFGDKRMAFTAILLPGLLIYVLYTIMGNVMVSDLTGDSTAIPTVAVVQAPDSLRDLLEQSFNVEASPSPEEAQDSLNKGTAAAAVIFPGDFDAQVAAHIPGQDAAPLVEVYFSTASTDSPVVLELLVGLLDAYEDSLSNKFDVAQLDVAPAEAASSQFFATLLPMLLMMFLFSGCMAVAPESIAGEKERGTIATLLITPVGRSQIALGKIIALSMIALLSGASSTLGTILSLPKLTGGEMSGNIYAVPQYLALGVTIFSTVLLLVTLISIISTFAKTVKEASTMTMPLMILVSLMGVLTMAGTGDLQNLPVFLVPLFNSAKVMAGILALGEVGLPLLITVISNLVYTVAGVWILTKLFRSERILYKV